MQVEITNEKEIQNFDEIVQCEDWIELDNKTQEFNYDISIVESYKSSKDKSREIFLDKNSNHIKLIIDGKSTILYQVEDEISDKIYNRISTILYNHSENKN